MRFGGKKHTAPAVNAPVAVAPASSLGRRLIALRAHLSPCPSSLHPQFRPVLRSSSLWLHQPSAHLLHCHSTLNNPTPPSTQSLVLPKAQLIGSRQLPGLRGEACMLPFQSLGDNVAFPVRRETEQRERQTGEGTGKHFVPIPKPRTSQRGESRQLLFIHMNR